MRFAGSFNQEPLTVSEATVRATWVQTSPVPVAECHGSVVIRTLSSCSINDASQGISFRTQEVSSTKTSGSCDGLMSWTEK